MPHPKHKKPDDGQAVEKLGRKRYNEELARLQGDLVRLQEAVVRDGLKVLIVYRGPRQCGKGRREPRRSRAGDGILHRTGTGGISPLLPRV